MVSPKTFMRLLNGSAQLARSTHPLRWMSMPVMRIFGSVTWLNKKGKRQADLQAMGRKWQRMFPGKTIHTPITEVTDNTVYAEIHTQCPLRGTGDVQACHRLMAYDRSLLQKMGGQFVVLQSQSNSGQPFCKVAMRKTGADMSDLVEAHKQW